MNIGRFFGVRFEDNEYGMYRADELEVSIDGTTDRELQAQIDVQCDVLCEIMGVDELEIVNCNLRTCGGRSAYLVIWAYANEWEPARHALVPVTLTEEEAAGIIDIYADGIARRMREAHKVKYQKGCIKL